MKFVVKPRHQTAYLVTCDRVFGQQAWLRVTLFDEFANGRTFCQSQPIYAQERNLARRVQLQIFQIVFLVTLFHQLYIQLLFGQRQTHFTAKRGKRHMVQTYHVGRTILVETRLCLKSPIQQGVATVILHLWKCNRTDRRF